MLDVLHDNGIEGQFLAGLAQRGIQTRHHFRGVIQEGDAVLEDDEASDEEDPEERLRDHYRTNKWLVESSYNFVSGATAIAEAQQLRLDYERRSMSFEDCRSNLDRNCLRFQ